MSVEYAHGKICYIEIPATDVAESSRFYEQVFNWRIRQRGDGATAFDDSVGQVSGVWRLDRQPVPEPGPLIYLMVADAAAALHSVTAAGGTVVRTVDPDESEIFAWFADPAGNLMGIYQQPGLGADVD